MLLSLHVQASRHNVERISSDAPYPSKEELANKNEWSSFAVPCGDTAFIYYYPNNSSYPQKDGAVISLQDDDMFIHEPGKETIQIPLKRFHSAETIHDMFCKSTGHYQLPDGRSVAFTLQQSCQGRTYCDMPKIRKKVTPVVQDQKLIRCYLFTKNKSH